MPNDDITHPIPDLTGYITEGQIVLDRILEQNGIYPPISVLPSLSRLMKDGIGEKYTRADHSNVSNQLFASYAKVQDAKALASVIGEEELSPTDKQYLQFGKAFEEYFLSQGVDENRSIDETLDLGWALLSLLPKEELDRVDPEMLEQYYHPENAERFKAVSYTHLAAFALPFTGFAAEATTAATEAVSGAGLGYLGAALSTGLASIGAGVAVAAAVPAAIGLYSEDPKSFGKGLIFVALGEGIALYGILVSILIINKL